MAPISRQEAIEMGLLRYYTGKPCKNGHVCERLVSCWTCVECNRANVKKQAATTPNRVRANKQKSDRKNSITKRQNREQRTGQKWLNERVREAVRNGLIMKTVCIICGEKSEAHHPDYSNPLSVVWLCRKHHMEVHNGL